MSKSEEKVDEKAVTKASPQDAITAAQAAESAAGDAKVAHQQAQADGVAHWDALYDHLKEIKLSYEWVDGSAIKESKLWAVLGSINTAE